MKNDKGDEEKSPSPPLTLFRPPYQADSQVATPVDNHPGFRLFDME